MMGSADAEEDERPVHRVYVSEFLIGRFPVTQEEYARFVRATGHPAPAVRSLPLVTADGREAVFKDRATPYVWNGTDPPDKHGSHPVVLIGFSDALAYCGWLSNVLQRPVRLPTEAEWEKAARGGVDGRRYPWGDAIDASHGHFLSSGADRGSLGTRPTGTFAPNGYGLYDMIGNVWEWISDWYAADYYASSEARDPAGPATGSMRIVRGGSWVNNDISMLRTAYRHRVPPDTYAYSVGFRVVCTDSLRHF